MLPEFQRAKKSFLNFPYEGAVQTTLVRSKYSAVVKVPAYVIACVYCTPNSASAAVGVDIVCLLQPPEPRDVL